jgi:hypothetical protein
MENNLLLTLNNLLTYWRLFGSGEMHLKVFRDSDVLKDTIQVLENFKNLIEAGYLSPEQHQKEIEEAKNQWMDRLEKQAYHQNLSVGIGKFARITHCLVFPDNEWQALKDKGGGE